MNTYRLPLLVFWMVGAFVGSAAGQNSYQYQGETAFASTASNHSNPPKDITVHHFSKRLPQTYSGYAIEVTASTYPLRKDHKVFRQFGSIFYEKLSGGGYSYLIKGDFSTKEAALDFVTNIIIPRAPEARLFEYKEGIRKIVRN